MDSSFGRSLFQKRNERIDWRKLAAVDVEKIARDVDVDAIQENILNVTYCNVEHELGYHGLDANVIKLFRLAQLTIEYLLHSQEFLQQCLSDKDKKIESFNEQLNISLSQINDVKDDLSKRNESYKTLKKELQKSKKLIGDYQLMVRAGASGLHRCSLCTKSFVSEYYLRSHVERRHPEEIKLYPPQVANVSFIQDETLQNELDGIKSRLKTTEDELRREHDNVFQLTLKEGERNQEFADILKRNEIWKHEEQEQIKAEMEGYKKMMMKELKETQKENEQLKKNLYNLEQSTEQWKKSSLGNLEDDDGGTTKVQYEDLGSQIKELNRQLAESRLENEELKKSIEKWRATDKKLLEDERKYEDLNEKVYKLEIHFKKEYDRLANKYQNDLEKAKELCNDYVEKMKQNNYLSTLNTPDVVDAKPVKSPRAFDVEADGVIFWVSSNLSIINCFKVSQKAASSKGEWSDVFSFRSLLVHSDLFEKPIHVYSCGGSPYWRQYISLSDQPPSSNYKREFTFYGSATKLMGTLKYFILDTSSGTVIRSMISRKENVEGWKNKGAYFYALKAGVSRNSLNRSGTYNSDVFRSVSDDEVSLSSLTGTDVVKDNLAEALKQSRENLCADNDSGNKVEDFESESDSESEKMEESREEEAAVEEEREEENRFIGTSSSSFLGSTIPEKGQFYPFPDNPLAVARYNHSTKMVNAQREEMIKILEDNLIKRGVDLDKDAMGYSMFLSKMKNHEKEVKLIEKRYTGCIERRKRLLKSVEDFAAAHCGEKKKKKWRSVETVVKAAVRFSDDVSPIRKQNVSTPTDMDLQPPREPVQTATSTPKDLRGSGKPMPSQPDDDGDDFDVSDESSDWNSEELENQDIPMHDNKTSTQVGESNDFASTGSTQQWSYQQPSPVKSSPSKSPNNDNDKDDDISDDSSQWDSDELSVKHLKESPEVIVSNPLEDSFDQYDVYQPKMRPPVGEKVKELTASLELTLGTRDPSKKKPAGAVDLHNI